MESLYILEPGATLRREGNSLKVFRDNQLVERIPAEGLKRLVLVGNVSLTGPVLDFLISRRIETAFITKTGRFRARLAVDEHLHVERRRAQYINLSDDRFALKTARAVVEGKLRNQAAFLKLRGRRYQDEKILVAALKLKSMAEHCESVEELASLRGLEGAAGQAYYSVFDRLIRNDGFAFGGRNKRPPKDPVNALLSFIYTLLTNEVLSAIKTCGLDPYLGALHEVSYGRPSLACDLVEEYRAFLGDRVVLGLINKKMINPDDFIVRDNAPENFIDEEDMKRKRPVEMKPAIARSFIAAYEQTMRQSAFHPGCGKNLTYRRLLLQQAYSFGEYLENPQNPEKLYRPFSWEK